MQQWTEANIPKLSGKTVLVTGANSGLGFNTSRALAAKGAKVIMACRTEDKAAAAMQAILAEVPEAELEFRPLDLANLQSISTLATGIAADKIKLDLLINNAGVMAVPYAKTADGFEMQMGTNHLGHFALTQQLLTELQPNARIVCVASMAHRWTPGIKLNDLDWSRRKYQRWQAYGDSKLANLLFMYELQRRLTTDASSVIAVAAHPGYANTNLQYVAAEKKQSRLEKLLMKVGNTAFAQSAAMGALPSLYAATAPEVNGGDYIGPGGFQQMRGYPAKVGSRAQARDADLGAKLWAKSVELTGVVPNVASI